MYCVCKRERERERERVHSGNYSDQTMAMIPVRFKRVSAAFDEVARARLCESSGSEHSAAESPADLSELVDQFLERESGIEDAEKRKREEERGGDSDSESYCSETETKEVLISLIGDGDEVEDFEVKRRIRSEIEIEWQNLGIGGGDSEGFMRKLMSLLRQRGFDAGVCKSRWEKTARHPAGEYEFIDIIIAKTRYIVGISLSSEFTIARQTNNYASLLESFPQIVVCKEGELKQVIRLMCNAMRVSLKKRELHVPPWRRNGYLHAKWFGLYRRTTNEVAGTKVSFCSGGKSLVGFQVPVVAVHGNCRSEVVRKGGLNVM